MTLAPIAVTSLVLALGLTGCAAIQPSPIKVDTTLVQSFKLFTSTFDLMSIPSEEERNIVSSAMDGVNELFDMIQSGSTNSTEFTTQLVVTKLHLQQVRGLYIRHRGNLPAATQAIYDEWAIKLSSRILDMEDNPSDKLAQLVAAANSIKQLIEVIHDVRR